jgi:hypothetical protein
MFGCACSAVASCLGFGTCCGSCGVNVSFLVPRFLQSLNKTLPQIGIPRTVTESQNPRSGEGQLHRHSSCHLKPPVPATLPFHPPVRQHKDSPRDREVFKPALQPSLAQYPRGHYGGIERFLSLRFSLASRSILGVRRYRSPPRSDMPPPLAPKAAATRRQKNARRLGCV